MLCFVYVSQHNTKELEREENILVLNTTCAILKMSSNLKEPSIIVALKSLIENLLCNIVGLTKNMIVIVRWCMRGTSHLDQIKYVESVT